MILTQSGYIKGGLSIRDLAKMEERLKLVSLFLLVFLCSVSCNISLTWAHVSGIGEQPLSKIAIHKTVVALHDSATVKAYPGVLGLKVFIFIYLVHFFSCFCFIITFG